MHRVLLLGPDDEARRALHLLIDRRGLAVVAANELESAKKHLAAADCDVVMAAPEMALDVAKLGERPPVIAILRTRDAATSQALLAAGVDDIALEPVDELALGLALHHAATRPRHRNGAIEITTETALVGDGPAMTKLRAMIKTVAVTKTTVLVTGETGTGKELVARAIHESSPRHAQRFVAVNCAAIPEALLESELFGHVRGAFTDAVRDKTGLFEEGDLGTVFLDEIGEMPLALQSKLLRVLQESEIRRVGDTQPISIDVRLIAATLRDLMAEVAAGRFREDLYYRLNVVPLHVPPLRDRPEDIPALARHFATRHAERHQRAVTLAPDVIEALSAQPWPGNVRDLENTIERLVVLADGPVIERGFLEAVANLKPTPASQTDDHELSIKKATRTLEQDLIRRALGVTQGNRTNAARLLEISHRALLYKMKEYGIS
ncbi:MAG: sigma 54-interacting transcriptional regulator [Deltaproteobacteria bacterium]